MGLVIIADNNRNLIRPSVCSVEHLWKYPFNIGMRISPEERKCIDEANTLEYATMMGDPVEAQFLSWLIKLQGAKKVIEIGVFRGSTSLSIARVLPEGGKLVACDVKEE